MTTRSAPAPLPWLTLTSLTLLTLLLCSPLFWAEIPPMVDVPGHIGAAAIEAAAPGSPLRSHYLWQWAFIPNLGGEALMKALAPFLGLMAAGWWTALIATGCFAMGGMATIRTLNPQGAHAMGWALIFVLGFPWVWGFINFVLAAGLAMLAFALSVRCASRPLWRAMLLITAQPLVMMCHAVGGLILPILVAAEALGSVLDQRSSQTWAALAWRLIRQCWPLLTTLAFVALWQAQSPPPTNPGLMWDGLAKLDFMMEVLRDQHFVLDIASAVMAYLLLIFARKLGARWTWRQGLPALALIGAYALLPARINGSEAVDTRMLSVAMLLALGLTDWSLAKPRIARAVMISGFGLLALRLAVITLSVPVYQADFAAQLQAVHHMQQGSRVVVLRPQSCANVQWRMSRLDNLAALASVEKQVWINSHWAIPGLHMVQQRLASPPAPAATISPMVWDPRCPESDGRSLDVVIHSLPLDRIDYVWLLDTGSPSKVPASLRPVWHISRSTLYRIQR